MITTEAAITVNTSGHILAFDVPEDVFMRDYAEHFCEWVNGTVIKMSPIHTRHDKIMRYITRLIEAYFELKPIGEVCNAAFVMRIELEQDGETKRRDREPDIQVILDSNPHALTDTYMDGPADIVIEIVSSESRQHDYAEKFHEYEQVGVPEYWIIDPLKDECRFYHRNARNAYVLQDAEDSYQSPRLPGLTLHIPTLWQEKLPGPMAVAKAVQAMVGD